MAKKNLVAKVFAYLALFWIVIWMIWTWMLFIFWNNSDQSQVNKKIENITPEKLKEMIKSGEIKVKTQTWETTK